MSNDYAIRQLFLRDSLDAATIRSALSSLRGRMGVPIMLLVSPEGKLIGDTRETPSEEELRPFRQLVTQAATREDEPKAQGFAYLGKALYGVLVLPLYAPKPEIIAWVGLAYKIDEKFIREADHDDTLEFTFGTDRGDVLFSTLKSTEIPGMVKTLIAQRPIGVGSTQVTMAGESYLTAVQSVALLNAAPARIILQRSLDAELVETRKLERILLLLTLVCVALAVLFARLLARNVSQPIQSLASHTEQVAKGDYSGRIELDRADEIGQLAIAFNRMTEGLAERDRVRDLLGKVVSPEIAAQLLHSQAVLGGEEREVTILFSDLRNFTALSEHLAPQEVLTLLNRYLDRMSAIIEEHHGVVDKYIGDAVMALFGAPIADEHAADHALAAALAMRRALIELNQELAAEGRPALRFGVGINTSRVVAGNMGSRRRLNYTVIGDGVNVAARLEELTKDPAYQSSILVSETTLRYARRSFATRALGEISVRGRIESIKVFALDA